MLRDDLRLSHSALGASSGLESAVTAFAPPDLEPGAAVTVVFAFPGIGYSRGYYDIPGAGYSQARHHVERGCVFVACDHLGVGESDALDPADATFEAIAAGNHATVVAVLERLRAGTLLAGLPSIEAGLVGGVGQSGGGMYLTVQQAGHRTFDAIALLGWSGLQTVVPFPPDYDGRHAGNLQLAVASGQITMEQLVRYAFHHRDVDPALLEADIARSPVPPWASLSVPLGADLGRMQDPGVAQPWASKIDVPVFIGVGERDVCPQPRDEPSAYPRSDDITVTIVPAMAHMHNFAGTRARLWNRLQEWFAGVGRDHAPDRVTLRRSGS